MPTSRDIRDQYRDIIGSLAREHGAAASGYEISRDATLAACIGYSRRFIVGRANDEPHYRYGRYMRVLSSALRRNPVNTGTVVHVDIGCGPGLFTWVVRDYFRASPKIEVDLYGYDHSKEMVRLADYIWERLEEDVDYMCFHKTKDLLAQLSQINLNPAVERSGLPFLGAIVSPSARPEAVGARVDGPVVGLRGTSSALPPGFGASDPRRSTAPHFVPGSGRSR